MVKWEARKLERGKKKNKVKQQLFFFLVRFAFFLGFYVPLIWRSSKLSTFKRNAGSISGFYRLKRNQNRFIRIIFSISFSLSWSKTNTLLETRTSEKLLLAHFLCARKKEEGGPGEKIEN